MPADLVETLAKLDVEQNVSASLFDAWQMALRTEPPRDLDDLRSKLSAISNTEAADELEAVVRWFEEANAMHALGEDQETRALADEINEARKLIGSIEKLIGQADALINDAKPDEQKLSKQAKKRQLGKELQRTTDEIRNRQEKIEDASPKVVSEAAEKMIAQMMRDLQRSYDSLQRRAVKLG